MDSIYFKYDNNINVQLPDHAFSKRMHQWANKEIKLRSIVTLLINQKHIQSNIIDLGAYVGDNSIPWAKNHPEGTVYAIDPSKDNCEYIKNFSYLNNINNIEIIQKAIGEKESIISTNSSSMQHCSFQNNSLGKNKIKSYSLDCLYLNKEIDNIGLIHLDVEGMEFQVILGCKNIIAKFQPIILFEQHLKTDQYKKLCKHMESYNYINYMIPEICGAKSDCRNFISVPKKLNNIIVSIKEYLK